MAKDGRRNPGENNYVAVEYRRGINSVYLHTDVAVAKVSVDHDTEVNVSLSSFREWSNRLV
jgi:hypothetical protein